MPTGRKGRDGRIAGAGRGRGAVARHAGPAAAVYFTYLIYLMKSRGNLS